MKYKVEVEIPTDTQNECAKYTSCCFLLNDYCVLFGETVAKYDGHTYKTKECPASGEKRYDEH